MDNQPNNLWAKLDETKDLLRNIDNLSSEELKDIHFRVLEMLKLRHSAP